MESVKTNTVALACPKKLSVFECQIDRLTKSEAIDLIWSWVQDSSGLRYVVTPNVHHLVLLRKYRLLREAYRHASLTLVDGRPVQWALNLLGDPVPEVIPGSDLVPTLFGTASRHRNLKVFLLGAGVGVAEKAQSAIHANWPFVQVVGTYSPRRWFESDEVELATIIRMVRATAPDLLIIGLGCPKQETWVFRFREEISARVAICCGATIDFIAGHRKRAPVWIQKIGCEWLFRALSEPLKARSEIRGRCLGLSRDHPIRDMEALAGRRQGRSVAPECGPREWPRTVAEWKRFVRQERTDRARPLDRT